MQRVQQRVGKRKQTNRVRDTARPRERRHHCYPLLPIYFPKCKATKTSRENSSQEDTNCHLFVDFHTFPLNFLPPLSSDSRCCAGEGPCEVDGYKTARAKSSNWPTSQPVVQHHGETLFCALHTRFERYRETEKETRKCCMAFAGNVVCRQHPAVVIKRMMTSRIITYSTPYVRTCVHIVCAWTLLKTVYNIIDVVDGIVIEMKKETGKTSQTCWMSL